MKFGSQLVWKSKTWFFTFLSVYVSWIEQEKILIWQLSLLKFRYFTENNEPKGGPHENQFDIFQIQKWISQTVRAHIIYEKNGVILLVSFFPSWVMVLKLPKIVHLLQMCADISKTSKCIKAIYLYSSERPYRVLSRNSMFCRGLSNSPQDIDE